MAKKKKKSARRRVAAGRARPAAKRGSRGRSAAQTAGARATHPEAPQHAEFLGDLDRFAKGLRESAGEAGRFYWDVFDRTGGWPQAKKGQTQFANRAGRVAREFRGLHSTLTQLLADCPDDALCRSLVGTLGDVELDTGLLEIAEELEQISLRARQPLTAEEHRNLLDDLRSLTHTLDAMLTAAEWIEDEVKVIRGRSRQSQTERAPLPAEVEQLLVSSEREARKFMTALGHYRSRERGEGLAAIEFLGLLQEEQKRLARESDVFAATLRRFTDSHRVLAEQQGHEDFLRFLDLKEDVLRRVAARRRVGIELLSGLIDEVKNGLSYDVDSEANEAVHRILPALDAYEARLLQQRDLCHHLVRQAAGERDAAAVSESDLPEWDAIVSARKGDGSRLADLDMLIMALRVEGDDNVPSFVAAPTNALREQLDRLFPERGPFADSWVRRRLADAVEHKIVVKVPRLDGQSSREPDFFTLSEAAGRKYGRHLSAVHRGRT
jgi:hypothetical protein